jgi:hypothetical protein
MPRKLSRVLGALGDVISHQPFDRFELEGASALLSGEPV